MKLAILAVLVSAVSAFAPNTVGSTSTALNAEAEGRREFFSKAGAAAAFVAGVAPANAVRDYENVGYLGGSGIVDLNNANVRAYLKMPDEIQSPIPISSSPTLYANKLTEHKYTVKLIKETRAICDDDKELHCFMTGIPFDFWEQYLTVDEVLVRLCCVCTAAGFGVATLFLFFQLNPADESFGRKDKIIASLCGGLLIALTIILCLVPVIGISSLADVNLTAFSNMAFVMSVSFATEYSVHVVHRFLSAPTSIKSASDRVAHTMKFLIDPLTLSFVSSSIGVVCLAFTDFSFNERFFFRPLMIVMAVTYLIGSFFLPMLLTLLDFDVLKVGHKGEEIEEEEFKEQPSA